MVNCDLSEGGKEEAIADATLGDGVLSMTHLAQSACAVRTLQQSKGKERLSYYSQFVRWRHFVWLAFRHANTLAYSEFCNFLLRTKILLTADKRTLGIDMGPWWEVRGDGTLQRSMRTHARIQDIKAAFENRQWGTILDRQLFLEGWDAGVRFARRNSYRELSNSNTSTDNLD